MKKKLLIGNWKMNGCVDSARALARDIVAGKGPAAPEIVLCPSFVHLSVVTQECSAVGGMALGAQNCAEGGTRALTGEVSAAMLSDLGVRYVIVGHSERRAPPLEETSESVARKVAEIHKAGMVAILCVGETAAARAAGDADLAVREQLLGALPLGASGENTVIAYEPVWAIGTGHTAQGANIVAMHARIRAVCEERLAKPQELRMVYGGSVRPENAAEIAALSGVDGVLVGGASLKASDFLEIARAFAQG